MHDRSTAIAADCGQLRNEWSPHEQLMDCFEAQRPVMRTSFTSTERDRRWETAIPEDIAVYYTDALRWKDHVDLARTMRCRIGREVQTRFGVGAEGCLSRADLDDCLSTSRRSEGTRKDKRATQHGHVHAVIHAAGTFTCARPNDADAVQAPLDAASACLSCPQG